MAVDTLTNFLSEDHKVFIRTKLLYISKRKPVTIYNNVTAFDVTTLINGQPFSIGPF